MPRYRGEEEDQKVVDDYNRWLRVQKSDDPEVIASQYSSLGEFMEDLETQPRRHWVLREAEGRLSRAPEEISRDILVSTSPTMEDILEEYYEDCRGREVAEDIAQWAKEMPALAAILIRRYIDIWESTLREDAGSFEPEELSDIRKKLRHARRYLKSVERKG